MSAYNIIDDPGQSPKPDRRPFNPWTIFLITLFTGPVIGGIIGLFNYFKLNSKGNSRTITLLLVITATLLYFLPIFYPETIGTGLIKDMLKEMYSGIRFVLAFYLVGTQVEHFNRHTAWGGGQTRITLTQIAGIIILIYLLVLIFLTPHPKPDPSYDELSPSERMIYQSTLIPRKDQIFNITAYAGSAPVVDGVVEEQDAWFEGERIHIDRREKAYDITTKHDFQNLYVLIESKGPQVQNDRVSIYFEQDEGGPDHNVNNGLTDFYVFIPTGKGKLFDSHYLGYPDNANETQNGQVKGKFYDNISSLEWKIPLRSGDPYDIYINTYPAELGFSIINLKIGIFPVNAHPYLPGTWGNMLLVDINKPEGLETSQNS